MCILHKNIKWDVGACILNKLLVGNKKIIIKKLAHAIDVLQKTLLMGFIEITNIAFLSEQLLRQ